MNREDVPELHFITAIANVPSILREGTLPHQRAARLRHVSVAAEEIQDRRRGKRVPGGQLLHAYANLYLNGRNKMLFRVRRRAAGADEVICVLRVSPDVLDLPGVVQTDQNAASGHARFGRPADTLARLRADRAFARYWTSNDPIEAMRLGSIVCAEALVPGAVPPVPVVVTSASSCRPPP